MHQQLGHNSKFYEPTSSQIDYKDFSPWDSEIQTELAPFNVGSPFASDFGNDNNAFHFQDGTSEQDISLTEVLDEVFNNHDEYSFDESTSQKNSAVGSDIQLPGQLFMAEAVAPGNSVKDIDAYSDADAELGLIQVKGRVILCSV